MATHKHFLLEDRFKIEESLNDSLSFKAIGRDLNRDCTTISKEVRNHIYFKKTGSYGRPFNNCSHRMTCTELRICDVCTSHSSRSCRFCLKCSLSCTLYEKEICKRLNRPPYVCNGCNKRTNCTLEKVFYSSTYAQNEYELCRSESRSGISINEEEVKYLDEFVSPLILKGQSIHHICSNNRDAIMCSEKTIYNYLDYNLFSARNLDLPRKVRYRPRKSKTSHFKVDKSCRIGRKYEDFLDFMKANPDTPVVEMDSVEGIIGGKVLLTIHFTDSLLMLAFIRDSNNSRSVINIFERLYLELSPDTFIKLFPVILTDNGSEFSNPSAIEFDSQGNQRTKIFYCDPSAPYQKGANENNHELIRRIVSKGNSFNSYCQADITLMMNHINSYSRKKLNDRTPYDVFSFFHGKDVLKNFGIEIILPNEIILQPSLLKK